MGQLYAFNLDEFFKNYGIKNYVETGTGEGISLEYAAKYPFKNLYTIDIDGELVASGKQKFKTDSRISFFHDYSTAAFLDIFTSIKNEPTLFFLDAHFPFADFGKMSYEESIRTFKEIAFPLKTELELIKQNRKNENDVIIIDDFILYDPIGDYATIKEGIVWKYEWLQKELNLETNASFIYDLFGDTHKFEKDLRHQGYLILTPKL